MKSSKDNRRNRARARETGRIHFRIFVGVGILVVIAVMVGLLLSSDPNRSRQQPTNTSQTSTASSPQGPGLINPNTPVDLAEIEKQLTPRKAVMREWLEAAENVANQTKDQQAQSIVKLLKDNTVVCMPTEQEGNGGVRFLEAAKSPVWLGFVVIMTGEQMPGPHWQNIASNKGFGANFFAESRTIVVRDHAPTSPIWKGIILLHEGNHAGTAIFAPYNQKDPMLFSMDERDSHEFENRLLSALGGKPYELLLNREVERMKLLILSKGDEIGSLFVGRTDYNSDLDKIFGPAQSQFEKDYRQTHVWLHAVFTMLDRECKQGDIEMIKAKFLHDRYEESGILPSQ